MISLEENRITLMNDDNETIFAAYYPVLQQAVLTLGDHWSSRLYTFDELEQIKQILTLIVGYGKFFNKS